MSQSDNILLETEVLPYLKPRCTRTVIRVKEFYCDANGARLLASVALERKSGRVNV